jgi:hypothetical protein
MRSKNLCIFFGMLAMTISSAANAENGYSTVTEERAHDVDTVRDFINTKRSIHVDEKSNALEISGKVETKYERRQSQTHGKKQRGKGSSNLNPPQIPHTPYPKNEFEVEAALLLDYTAEQSWATIELDFKNDMGIREVDHKEDVTCKKNTLWGSGKLNKIELRKAFLGYNAYEDKAARFDIEVGRRKLFDVFESRIEFDSIFDGLLVKYSNAYDGVGAFSAKIAGFVIDENVNHFGYVGELALLGIADSGFDAKYSLITWDKQGVNRYNHKHARGAEFVNSQALVAYNLDPTVIGNKTRLYGAYLHNHAAHKSHRTDGKKANNAFYAGVTVGEIKKKNDWSFDFCYQYVQAQAIPENDISGIKRDNPRDISFYACNRQGKGNYQGFKIESFYALTDQLTLNAFFQRATDASAKIGGKHRSYKLQLAAIYAF